jgi:DNA-binding LacI/PurR family transcriptional regulator
MVTKEAKKNGLIMRVNVSPKLAERVRKVIEKQFYSPKQNAFVEHLISLGLDQFETQQNQTK